jgi:hypothetical protein
MYVKTVLAIISFVILVFGMLPSSISAPAFANKKNTPQDDKNNLTFPGTGARNNPHPSGQAAENTEENCDKHLGDANVPAQCQ